MFLWLMNCPLVNKDYPSILRHIFLVQDCKNENPICTLWSTMGKCKDMTRLMSKHCCATCKKVMNIPAPKGIIATTGFVQNYFCLDLLSMIFIVYCYLMKPARGLCRPHFSRLLMFVIRIYLPNPYESLFHFYFIDIFSFVFPVYVIICYGFHQADNSFGTKNVYNFWLYALRE